MRLDALFPDALIEPPAFGAREIAGLACDSRLVAKDQVFFAVPGTKADGLTYAPEAVRRGALAVVTEQSASVPFETAALVKVADVRSALAIASARFYARQPETVVAVTGTSGKTSVAAFARQIWASLGFKAASVGTLGVVAPDGASYGGLTTPDPISLHRTLDELAGAGVTHLALEASSHGLDQHRLDYVRLKAAGFTNLSRDHLDYHPTLEAYFQAKLLLFTHVLPADGTVVVDADSSAGHEVIDVAKARGLKVFSLGFAGETLHLLEARPEAAATLLRLTFAGKDWALRLPLVGSFQAANALMAAGLCISTGAAPDAVFAALERLEGAPGRLEKVGERRGASIFVDYAHKPDALEKALQALRPFTQKRLIVIFGCGGDRDAGKRPLMGEIAARLADHVIVTDDNPRSEDPDLIRKAILQGAGSGPHIREIGDREAAIKSGIGMLEPGDLLLIAGKGHETGQILADRTLPFSDRDCARAALEDHAA
ncbi:UDP-N-acetylmuramoyl-L-alanyl-D-glutamate--2,6-diaminopimelate ligase [Beijerinckia indica]|uniref:UDP-N-acetylmuramoyl-L-alanyl-D-glutamate--2,6-diaminopimelate ligase n=1 Tax=Beijerinckia indica subsp. indica (strain ATCC 9039 / DSM 1715 / NCIMB 8712) TaxID=395963 RepID=B2IGF5_BEII9|nr:UDP-N-acetylmuramoyl-L-alanyl-D-glutamate--2,6-diaminopimelate ligase [Beijerinckia indica]ACB94337.1 UDP-N-acetylmuramyl-tripeptide synthetase [Beijerinckia indica subsp. indica ATCC 9039]